jgi:branched-chain amino acid transport system substrate-binding protein
MRAIRTALMTTAAMVMAPTAFAQVNIGITVSQTGPAAALGIPQKNTVPMLPKEVAGQKIEYIVLDDATDPTKAVANARKMIAENKIDFLIGSSGTPGSMALVDVAAETKTPLCAMVPNKVLVAPMDDKRKWVFKAPQDDALLAEAIAKDMVAKGIKSVGFIGYTDGYGQGWIDAAEQVFAPKGIKITAVERFQRTDTSVTAQALKILSTSPDAVLIAASGTVAAMPQKALKEQGYTKQIYQTGGVATMEFVRVGGKDVDGTIFPAGPVSVADLLPDSHPSKKISLNYIKQYEALNKQPFAAFGAHLADCASMFFTALKPALEKAKPGTPEFRAAIREGIENSKEIVALHGVFNFTPTDHAGLDERARVMIKIVNGKWTLNP